MRYVVTDRSGIHRNKYPLRGKRRQTTAEREGIGTDSNPRDVDEKNKHTAPSTYGRPLHQHPFDIGDVLEMWTWTMSIELYGPMLNGTMNSSVHMNKPTEQRYVGVFVHPRVSDGQYHCKRQAPYDKIECLLIYPSASVVPCGVSGYQPL